MAPIRKHETFFVNTGIFLLTLMCSSAMVIPVLAMDYNEEYKKTLREAGDTNQSQGIRAGGFLFFPALGLKTEFLDNVDNVHRDKTSDIVTTANGSLSVKSNWNRHMMMIGTNQTKEKYKTRQDRGYVAGSYFAQGRYDITDLTMLNVSLSHGKQHTARGTGEDVDVTSTIDYWVDTLNVEISRTLSYLQGSFSVQKGVSRILDKANVSGSDFEKKDIQSVGGTISYLSSPGNALYLRTNYTDNDYNLIDGTNRKTDLWNTTTGLSFNTGGLYSGDIFGRWQRYTDTALGKTNSSFSFGGSFQWNMTYLTSLRYTYGKTFSEGESSATNTALVTSQQLVLTDSITELWNAKLSLQKDDYDYSVSGNPAENTLYIGKLESSYSLTDSVGLNFGVSHQKKDTGNTDNSYNSNTVYFSLTYIP